jgi:beta-glucosidase
MAKGSTGGKGITGLLEQMTLEEKVAMCHADSPFTSAGCPRLGVPALVMSDGPHGVREESIPGTYTPAGGRDDCSTALPTGICLAAAWNTGLARKFGEVLGAEAAHRGKHVILGPAVNMQRTPLCGRSFEYMGEDPVLAARIAVEAIRGIQSQGAAACVKHFALNNQELDRGRVNVEVDDRALREVYLPAFEAAVCEAGVLTVMGAYNRFRGRHCCHHDWLLDSLLKGEWGFRGLVMSDWGGVHDTAQAAESGLDIEMGGGDDYGKYYLAGAYLDGLRSGRYPAEKLDDKVRRILYVVDRLGLLPGGRGFASGARNTPAHKAAARAIAEEGIVLLKNDGAILPLDLSKIRTLAVIGENATMRHCNGGGSSNVKPLYEVTPLEGLQARLGSGVRILHAQGYPEADLGGQITAADLGVTDSAGIRGWREEWFDNRRFTGVPLSTATVQSVGVDGRNLPVFAKGIGNQCSVHWVATFTPRVSGEHVFTLRGTDWSAFYVDDRILHSICCTDPATEARTMRMEAGREYRLRVVSCLKSGTGFLRFGHMAPGQKAAGDEFARAVEVARQADAVVFFGGLNHQHDTEGTDRYDLRMPAPQDDLIEALAEANRKLAVVLVGSGSIELRWLGRVGAVVQAWYPGQEGGHAIASVLCGDVCPSGRLPVSWPRRLEDTPAARYGEYQAVSETYREGLMVGYRHYDTNKVEPLFPFGHGLSYTTFEWSDLRLEEPSGGGGALLRVLCKVRNTGNRAGADVVQCYVADPESSRPRPEKELKAFSKVFLKPGEAAEVAMDLDRRAFSFWMPGQGWVVEPGRFRIMLGASSRDIRLAGEWVMQR